MDSKKSCFHMKLSVFGNFLVKLIENSKEIGNFWDMQQMVRCLHIYLCKNNECCEAANGARLHTSTSFFSRHFTSGKYQIPPLPSFRDRVLPLKIEFWAKPRIVPFFHSLLGFFSNFYIEKISRDPPVRDQLTKCFHICNNIFVLFNHPCTVLFLV